MTDAITESPPRPHLDGHADGDVVAPVAGPVEHGGGEPPLGVVGRARHAVADRWRRFASMPIEGFVSLFAVLACVAFTFAQLGPGDIFSTSTPAGGDMGAHVWGPAYLRDTLLPQGRLAGWTPDWYAGFPAYQFYMVLPSLAIAMLSYVVPYGTAFKLVAISGLLSLPVSAWAFGRLTRLPFPAPPLLAVGATLFLFDTGFHILGGNIASTLAGEFAFSIALSFAVLYLGVLGRGLTEGTHRGWAALLLALTALCHPIPLFFALAGTAVWFVLTLPWDRLPVVVGAVVGAGSLAVALALWAFTDLWRDDFQVSWVRLLVLVAVIAVPALSVSTMVVRFPIERAKYLVTVLPIAGALSAFWTVPFYLRHGYMNDMGWEKKTDYGNLLFTRSNLEGQLIDLPPIKFVLAFAAVGLLMAIAYAVADRTRGTLFWPCIAGVAAIAVVVAPQGRLWNARLLPFYYLALYLMAALAVAYIGRTLAILFARNPARPVRGVQIGTAAIGVCAGLVILAVPLRVMPRSIGIPFTDIGLTLEEQNSSAGYKWWILPEFDENSFVDSWASWNFSGYEGKAAYPEYHDVIATMQQVGEQHGCGRAMWEHEEDHNRYGTPMALMLLPFWTDGCIGSMEGLYFEASSTTPYHFINQDELSSAPSNAQRDLPYVAGAPSRTQFDQGITHLQMLGVRYYMAISDRMIDYASQNPALTEVASTHDWRIYQVADSELVSPLANEPAVLEGVPGDGKGWLDPSMDWYMDDDAWDVALAAAGPEGWQRIAPGELPSRRALPEVRVSNIETTNDRITFDVDRTGVPVVVKTSYFPNWRASGAEGPWRLTPNLMVVVPTSEHVELEYGTTGVELAAWALTFAGIAGLVWLFRAAPVTMPAPVRRRRVRATNGGPDGAGEVLDDAVAVDAGADEPVESSPVALDQPAREVSIGETAVGDDPAGPPAPRRSDGPGTPPP